MQSPQKASQKRSEEHRYPGEQGGHDTSQDSTKEFIEQMHDFPTLDQPLTDTLMKEMLVTLRGSLHRDLMECTTQLKAEVTAIGDRVSHTEDKMGEFATAHNELVDAYNAAEDEIQAIKSKMADLEDRSRRNNVKLRGVSESVMPADLRKYVQQFISALLPETLEREVIVDRAHRLPKPKHLPEKVPRDVIARIHFFHVKEDLMRYTRKNSPLPDPYADISVYSDISQHTMQARRNLATLTKLFQNHKIPYTWGFPTKIIVTRESKSYAITNLENGLKLARKWQLLPEEDENPTPSHSHKISQEWQKVKHG